MNDQRQLCTNLHEHDEENPNSESNEIFSRTPMASSRCRVEAAADLHGVSHLSRFQLRLLFPTESSSTALSQLLRGIPCSDYSSSPRSTVLTIICEPREWKAEP